MDMKIKIIILLVLSVFICTIKNADAQSRKNSRTFFKKLDLAHEELSYENYHRALPILRELWDIDTTNRDVAYMMGICIFNMKRESQESYSFFIKASSKFPHAYYFLGRLYHNNMLFDKALEAYLLFKNTENDPLFKQPDIDWLIRKSFTAKEFIRNTKPINVKLLDEGVNSNYPDYGPLLSPDGKTMYFTSRRIGSTGNLTDPNHEYFEDIYYSVLVNGTWQLPINIGQPINSNTHDAAVAISKDGKTLYFYRTNVELTGGDIYYSDLMEDKWTNPKKIDANINTPGGAETSISISPDGNTIYFSSNRPGGYGGKDLYRVTKMPDNTWSKAYNLGPNINTPYDEDGPFIHPDGKTLYFSSKGHHNMGGYDIFKTELNEDGIWSIAENLGYPINSVGDDVFFFVTHEGQKAYFSSNRPDSPGKIAIYQADIGLIVEPNYQIFKGTIITNDPEFRTLKSTITIIDTETNNIQGIYRTNNSGKYLLVLLPRKKYKLIIESEGYFSHIDEIDLTERLQLEDLFKSINLKKQPDEE